MSATKCLFGVETEYALNMLDQDGSAGRGAAAGQLVTLAREKIPCLPDGSTRGVFLQNGGRLYIDAGCHPEFSTPECIHPDDIVRYVHAGNQIMLDLADEVARRSPQIEKALLLRCNVDYGGTGNTWGCHESYLYREAPGVFPSQLIPHLVSRIVFSGAGGFNNLQPDQLAFTLSPRAFHMVHEIAGDSTGSRGIFHAKNEALTTTGFNRLHIIFGESLCSELALWLKVGTTALIVAMIDAGLRPGDSVALANPVDAVRTFAGDPSCRVKAAGKSGGALSAIEIQRRYLELAEENLGQRFMPDWAPEVCKEWRTVLSQLASGPDAVATRLDWAIKFALYRERIEQHGFTSDQIASWNEALERPAGATSSDLDPFETVDEDPPVSASVSRASPLADPARLRHFGLAIDDLDRFAALRDELLEIDVRFGALGSEGIFQTLSEAGVLQHRRIEGRAIARAIEEPPTGGRAALRGENVRRLSRKPPHVKSYICDWEAIIDQEEHTCLDLSDPFQQEAFWRDLNELEVARFDLQLDDRADQPIGVIRHLCRIGQYFDATSAVRRRLETVAGPETTLPARLIEATCAFHLGDNGTARQLLKRVADMALMRSRPEIYLAAASHLVLADLADSATKKKLLKAIAQIERKLGADEPLLRSSRLILVRSRIELASGGFDSALTLAQQALERSQVEPDPFDRELYHRTILACLIQLGQIDQIQAHVRSPGSRRQSLRLQAIFDAALGYVHQRRGAHRDAIRWTRAALRKSRHGQNQAEQVFIRSLALEAYVAAGRVGDAEHLAEQFYVYCSSEVAEHRFIARMRLGDFELARAQREATSAGDDARSTSSGSGAAPLDRTRYTERHYDRAATEAARIDRSLGCTWRSEHLEKRRVELRAAHATG